MPKNDSTSLKQLPDVGFVFWPVSTGDSTTICVDDKVVVQVDLHHLAEAEEEDSKRIPIIDELERLLPNKDGKPYLAVFVLTHPDEDHCRGFSDLLDRVHIGEIWFTPRVFREYKKDLCDDAVAFRDEAKRRVRETIEHGGDTESGDLVRIVGYDALLGEEEFDGFPEDRLTTPGEAVEELDGEDVTGRFRAFIHAPFKDDSTGDRNDCSLAMQVTLTSGEGQGRALLLGDLCYPTIRRIFDTSEDGDLSWNVMLAAHHCSKSVMYWKDEEDDEESQRDDILKDMEGAAESPGYIVASSDPVPATDAEGANPPHAKAKHRYQEIAPDGFLCTQEYPDEESPEPMVFKMDYDGFRLVEGGDDDGGGDDNKDDGEATKKSLAGSTAAVRGGERPPTERAGFGRE